MILAQHNVQIDMSRTCKFAHYVVLAQNNVQIDMSVNIPAVKHIHPNYVCVNAELHTHAHLNSVEIAVCVQLEYLSLRKNRLKDRGCSYISTVT